VNPFVDALMLILFVFFMVTIFRGYHIRRLEQIEEEESSKKGEEKRPEQHPSDSRES